MPHHLWSCAYTDCNDWNGAKLVFPWRLLPCILINSDLHQTAKVYWVMCNKWKPQTFMFWGLYFEKCVAAASITVTTLETDLSLLLLQFSFRLFHFIDKHLTHFFFFTLQVPQELFPLSLICLLQTGEKKRQGRTERENGDTPCRWDAGFGFLWWHLTASAPLALYLNGWLSGSVSLKPISSSLQRRYSS